MLKSVVIPFTLFAIIGLTGCSSEEYTRHGYSRSTDADTSRMTMKDVLAMTASGVTDSVIISMMNTTDTWFRLTPQNVVDLKNAGVSDTVIQAMMEAPPTENQSERTVIVDRYYPGGPFMWYGWRYPHRFHPMVSVRVHYPSGHHHRVRR